MMEGVEYDMNAITSAKVFPTITDSCFGDRRFGVVVGQIRSVEEIVANHRNHQIAPATHFEVVRAPGRTETPLTTVGNYNTPVAMNVICERVHGQKS